MKVGLTRDGRKYLIDGKEYARVTQVCSMIPRPELQKWKMRMGEEESTRIAKETGEYGDLVHEVTAYNDLNQMKKVEEMLNRWDFLIPPWVAWFDWVGKYVSKIIHVEIIVWSKKWRCAGKVDRVMIMKGDKRPSIWDLKTGSLYDEIGVQLHGYKLLYNESHNPKVDRTGAIHLPRINPGHIQPKDYDKKKYTDQFKSAVRLFHSLKQK